MPNESTTAARASLTSSSSIVSRDRIKLPKMKENNSDEDTEALKKKLETIPEVLQIPDQDGKIAIRSRLFESNTRNCYSRLIKSAKKLLGLMKY